MWYHMYFFTLFCENHSYDYLPLEKRLTLHNDVIHVKSVPNKVKMTTTIRFFQKNALIK